jgi:uncharacterized protein YukE
MALPRQVEAQLKEIEAIEKQLVDSQQQPTEPVEPTEPTEPVEATTPEPEPTEPVEPTPKPVEPEPQEEKWEQKYKTLKGMYDAEVPRLHAQLKDLKAQMDSLRQAAEAKPVEQPKPAAKEKLVTDEDVQAFGADLIEVQRKVAREVAMEFRADLDAMKSENEELRKMLAQTGNQVSEASFEQRLHRLVPDFDQINLDPKWVDWLNEIDPLLRAPRKSIAQEAFNRGDAEGVAHYVSLFRQTTEPAAAPKSKAKSELERQIQPTRSAATAQTASPKGRIYTDSDVRVMYQKAATLGAQGKLEEARKLEAEIDAAYMDGRVTA